jgi:hypothetical protein
LYQILGNPLIRDPGKEFVEEVRKEEAQWMTVTAGECEIKRRVGKWGGRSDFKRAKPAKKRKGSAKKSTLTFKISEMIQNLNYFQMNFKYILTTMPFCIPKAHF